MCEGQTLKMMIIDDDDEEGVFGMIRVSLKICFSEFYEPKCFIF